MSRFIRSEICEAASLQVSAFVDGELPFPESLAAVDHLATCDACRRFYLDSRRLAEQLAGEDLPAPSDGIWAQIQSGAGMERPEPREPRFGRSVYTAAAAIAALLLLAFTLSLRSFRTPSSSQPVLAGASTPSEIVIQGARGRMTDERFISLLAEILAADKKYHRETERVLRFVLGRENPVESDDREAPADDSEHEQKSRGEDGLAKSAGLSS